MAALKAQNWKLPLEIVDLQHTIDDLTSTIKYLEEQNLHLDSQLRSIKSVALSKRNYKVA